MLYYMYVACVCNTLYYIQDNDGMEYTTFTLNIKFPMIFLETLFRHGSIIEICAVPCAPFSFSHVPRIFFHSTLKSGKIANGILIKKFRVECRRVF